jgi:Ca-activated chloride channel family protein
MNRPLPRLEGSTQSIREISAGTVLGPDSAESDREQGFGALRTSRGCLPLTALEVTARIDGLLAQVEVAQRFVNDTVEPLEATYIFPLPARAGVTRFRMEVGERVIEGTLEERAAARQRYERAMVRGYRASIVEEERPEVFTLRVGNLMPGEAAALRLTFTGMLPYVDGEVTFRFPLVVAPRYIPGRPLTGTPVGSGTRVDTASVPDASRITPPVLLPGFPSAVQLAITVDLHDGLAPASDLRSSLHSVIVEGHDDSVTRIRLVPGEKLDRDFILRYRLGGSETRSTLTLHPDAGDDAAEGTFALTLLPPAATVPAESQGRDIVIVLDRSGSMNGWKIVAARRAVAAMIETLGSADRFLALAFNSAVESPWSGSFFLRQASDADRVRAITFVQGIEARDGTEMAPALEIAARALSTAQPGRRRILVLVTDGQVGNEDEILRRLAPMFSGVRVFTLGIDQAVNAGFLQRLAGLGDGDCELVESAKRLVDVTRSIHHRIAAPVRTAVALDLTGSGLELVADTLVPDRIHDLFPGTPLVLLGRYRGRPHCDVSLRSIDEANRPLTERVRPIVRDNPAIEAAWARGAIRRLEDQYAVTEVPSERHSLEKAIVGTSLRHGVLCRFTAFTAIDQHEVVNQGGEVVRVTQPVELPAAWEAENVTMCAPSLKAEALFLRAGDTPSFGTPRSRELKDIPTVWSDVMSARAASESVADPQSLIPDRFEQPRIAGLGGLGRAYVAFDRSRGQTVRLEVLPERQTRDFGKRLATLKKLTRWTGPSVIALLEVIKTKKVCIVVSDEPSGYRLDRWLERRGEKLPARDAARIVAEVAEALAGAHRRRVHFEQVHLGDIYIGEQAEVFVDASSLERNVHRRSRSSFTMGEFSAPELWRPSPESTEYVNILNIAIMSKLVVEAPFSERCEVYALGALLYRLSAGRTIARVWPSGPLRLDPTRISDPALAAIQTRACSINPNDRFATVAELASRLRGYLASTSASG